MIKEDLILKMIEEGSGDMQHDAAVAFENTGWKVQVAPHYLDIVTGKPREIDLIARKEFKVTESFCNRTEIISVRIFIECKYIKNETLFRFADKNIKKAQEIAKDNNILRSEEYVDISKNHYLIGSEVAKTWETVPGGRDDVYDAWQQSLHSMIYFQKNQREGRYVIDYPLVLLKSFENIYRRDNTDKKYSKINNNFLLEVDYSYLTSPDNASSKTFLIDLTDFSQLDDFLKTIESDLSILRTMLADHMLQENSNMNRQDDAFNSNSFFI